MRLRLIVGDIGEEDDGQLCSLQYVLCSLLSSSYSAWPTPSLAAPPGICPPFARLACPPRPLSAKQTSLTR